MRALPDIAFCMSWRTIAFAAGTRVALPPTLMETRRVKSRSMMSNVLSRRIGRR